MMTAKEILNSCRDAVLELKKLDTQLARCLPTGQPAGVKVQQYDADPPGTNDPTAAAIQLYEGLMQRRDSLAQSIASISKAAWSIINTQKDARILAILNGYYLLGQTDQEIAHIQGLTRVYITQMRNAAIKTL